MLTRRVFGQICATAWLAASLPAKAASAQVGKLRVTLLSTMLAEPGLGEWGFAALVETDGRKLLFDTGAHPDLVLSNVRDLKIDLADIEEVIISHNHWDHVGGLLTLRREMMKSNPKALSRAHVGAGIFLPRLNDDGKDQNGLQTIRADYEALGGAWIVHDHPTEILPGVTFSGPVPRKYDERNYLGKSGKWLFLPSEKTGDARPVDNVPEDSALIFDSGKGLVVLTGCGHAGIVNICDYARASVRNAPLEAVIGGLHLFQASDQTLAWTAGQLKAMGLHHLLAAHCTGIEATYKLRDGTGLDRKTAVVGAVGASYDLEAGLNPGKLAG